jgi:hypothetical protein
MPSHPDRVRKNNRGICEICLKNPIALLASRTYWAINRTNFCEKCLEDKRNPPLYKVWFDA